MPDLAGYEVIGQAFFEGLALGMFVTMLLIALLIVVATVRRLLGVT